MNMTTSSELSEGSRIATDADEVQYQYLYKILLVGDSGVGKSCLLIRFCDDSYPESKVCTIGVDFQVKTVELDGKHIKVQIWDSAGQERFRTLSGLYYRGAHGVGVVFDVTDEESFQNVESWLEEVECHGCVTAQRLLIGNKCDLTEEREVSSEEAAAFAASHDMKYIETSAKKALNVGEAFMSMVEEIYEARYGIRSC